MSNSLKDLESMHVVMIEFHKISKVNRLVLLGMLTKEHEQIGELADDPYYEIKKRFLAAGGRSNGSVIPYIKEVRSLNGLTLQEAQKLVESW